MANAIHHNEDAYRKLIARIEENSEEFTKRLCQSKDEVEINEIEFLNNDFGNHNVLQITDNFRSELGAAREQNRPYGFNTTENTSGVYEMITEMLKDGVTIVNEVSIIRKLTHIQVQLNVMDQFSKLSLLFLIRTVFCCRMNNQTATRH